MNFNTLHKQRKAILIAAVIGVIAVFLPWITVGFLGQSIHRNGFHGIGILAFLALAGAGAVSLLGNQSSSLDKGIWFAALALGGLALLAVVIFIVNTSNDLGSVGGFAGVGFGIGLWLTLIGSAGVVAAAWLLKSPGDSLRGGFESLKNNIPGNISTTTSHNPGSTSAGGDKMAQLERLITLRNEGKITEEEYQDLKSKIL